VGSLSSLFCIYKLAGTKTCSKENCESFAPLAYYNKAAQINWSEISWSTTENGFRKCAILRVPFLRSSLHTKGTSPLHSFLTNHYNASSRIIESKCEEDSKYNDSMLKTQQTLELIFSG
jgi:hypothetical protein